MFSAFANLDDFLDRPFWLTMLRSSAPFRDVSGLEAPSVGDI